jgi:hypothetical protein
VGGKNSTSIVRVQLVGSVEVLGGWWSCVP